jgi:hypothetical protein
MGGDGDLAGSLGPGRGGATTLPTALRPLPASMTACSRNPFACAVPEMKTKTDAATTAFEKMLVIRRLLQNPWSYLVIVSAPHWTRIERLAATPTIRFRNTYDCGNSRARSDARTLRQVLSAIAFLLAD